MRIDTSKYNIELPGFDGFNDNVIKLSGLSIEQYVEKYTKAIESYLNMELGLASEIILNDFEASSDIEAINITLMLPKRTQKVLDIIIRTNKSELKTIIRNMFQTSNGHVSIISNDLSDWLDPDSYDYIYATKDNKTLSIILGLLMDEIGISNVSKDGFIEKYFLG